MGTSINDLKCMLMSGETVALGLGFEGFVQRCAPDRKRCLLNGASFSHYHWVIVSAQQMLP